MTLEEIAKTLKPGEYALQVVLHSAQIKDKLKEEVVFQAISDIAATCVEEGKKGSDYLGTYFMEKDGVENGDDVFILIFKEKRLAPLAVVKE